MFPIVILVRAARVVARAVDEAVPGAAAAVERPDPRPGPLDRVPAEQPRGRLVLEADGQAAREPVYEVGRGSEEEPALLNVDV